MARGGLKLQLRDIERGVFSFPDVSSRVGGREREENERTGNSVLLENVWGTTLHSTAPNASNPGTLRRQ